MMKENDYQSFYDRRRNQNYSYSYTHQSAQENTKYSTLKKFIEEYDLSNKKCLEIGSSGGFFQDMVQDYYGTDVAHSLTKWYHKPYKVAEGTTYPYADEMFDAIWTFAVYEHIPHLQEALLEIERLLKPGGVVLFQPAWQCRSWAADGYAVRPYSDFGIKGKLIKISIPFRDSIQYRSFKIFPKRIFRHLRFVFGYRYNEIRYKKIKPNYERHWVSDSDACNHIDPHDAILWFESHGLKCLSHPIHLSAFFVKNSGIVLRKLGRGLMPDFL